MPGLEGASGLNVVAGAAASVEGGLGAAATAVPKIENMSSAVGEIGINPISSHVESFTNKLGTTLNSAPDIGIKQVAAVDLGEFPTNSSDAGKIVEQSVSVGSKTPEVQVNIQPNGAQAEPTSDQPPTAGKGQQEVTSTVNPQPEAQVKPVNTLQEQQQGKQSTEGKPGQTAEPQNEVKASTEQNQSPEQDKASKIKELEEGVKNKTATADQIKQLRELKQDPDVRRQTLEQKALDGTITDPEAQELGNLNTKIAEKLTPEQQTEELKKQADALGTRIMDKLANGESITPEDLEELRNLRAQESLINQGFSAEDSKAVVEAVSGRSGRESGRQVEAIKEIKDKVQELMSIELQLMSLPKQVDALRKQRKTVQQDAQKKHKEAEGVTSDEARLQKKGEEYGLYMQIANINGEIVKVKNAVPLLDARRKDLEQYVRRKLGVTGGFTAFMEWASAKVTNVATEVGVGVSEEVDYRTGNF